jgi:DNA-directed RNA polymerase specialized sigma24 family protein
MPCLRWHRKAEGTEEEEVTIRDISDDVKNSDIERCIDEYVRPIQNREILRKHWFERKSFEQLAEMYHLSVTTIKNIIYKDGDRVLLKAAR